jgi:hypothetical protein
LHRSLEGKLFSAFQVGRSKGSTSSRVSSNLGSIRHKLMGIYVNHRNQQLYQFQLVSIMKLCCGTAAMSLQTKIFQQLLGCLNVQLLRSSRCGVFLTH